MKKYNIINNSLGWLCFFIAAATYLLTMEPTASFWDCPEFISQGAKLEVGHPPGNPIFMLTARFFVTLFGGVYDVSNAAIAVNAMSGLLSAATILLLFWTITHLTRRLIVKDEEEMQHLPVWKLALIMGGGLCGALAYTWSDTFWFSAVEGEVYAFSSFCTALVFWLILKWENRADQPHSDRYLILIAYVIGVSIAVHLLNLLCIPAIALVVYYRLSKNANVKGSLLSLLLSFVIVAAILYGLAPGFMRMAGVFEILFVNFVGLSYNMGALIYAVLLVASFIWGVYELQAQRSPVRIKISFALSIVLSGMLLIGNSTALTVVLILALVGWLAFACRRIHVRIFNLILMSTFVIFIGYSSYALLLIRATADTPMNQNAPDNVFDLASYMSREQYGENPLFYGRGIAQELPIWEDRDGTRYLIIDKDGNPKFDDRSSLVMMIPNNEEGYYIEQDRSYTKVTKDDESERDRYVLENVKYEPEYNPEFNMFFPRMYSTDTRHIEGYRYWSGYKPQYSHSKMLQKALVSTENGPMSMADAIKRGLYVEEGFVPLSDALAILDDTYEEVDATHYVYDEESDDMMVKDYIALVFRPTFSDHMKYFVNYQLNHMYWRYFMWNFSGRQNDLQGDGEPNRGNWITGIPFIDNARLGDQSLLPPGTGEDNKGHNVFYMMPLILGLLGLAWQALGRHANARRGIEQFWVVFFLFFMTGIAIVIYLNQTPFQPRERDYAFAGSFYAFAIWIGLGVPAIGCWLRKLLKLRPIIPASIAVVIGLLVPLQMVSQTWDDHDRSGRYTARDFGMNYLTSLDENAIIFTNGDNDTFPLWYAQEVEGFRTDVKVVNLSYLSQAWYANQVRMPSYDAPGVPFMATPMDYAYDRLSMVERPDTLNTMDAIEALKALYRQKGDKPVFPARYLSVAYDEDAAVNRWKSAPDDLTLDYYNTRGFAGLMSLDIIANSFANKHQRPVYFATTVGNDYYMGLEPYLHNTGMAYEVTPMRDPSVNLDKAYINIMTKFRWGGLDKPGAENIYLDETVRRMVGSTRSIIISSAEDMLRMGDTPAPENVLKAAGKDSMTYADMARDILNKLDSSMPAKVMAYDRMMGLEMAEMYFDLWLLYGNDDDLAAAKRLAAPEIARWSKWLAYYHSLPDDLREKADVDCQNANIFLAAALGINDRVALAEAMRDKGLAHDDIFSKLYISTTPDRRYNVYLSIYLSDKEMADLLSQAEKELDTYGDQLAEDMYNVLFALNEYDMDPMAKVNSLARKHSFSAKKMRARD